MRRGDCFDLFPTGATNMIEKKEKDMNGVNLSMIFKALTEPTLSPPSLTVLAPFPTSGAPSASADVSPLASDRASDSDLPSGLDSERPSSSGSDSESDAMSMSSAAAAADPSAAFVLDRLPAPKPKPYFLFLLGTDTAFKTSPVMGETTPDIDPLSYMALMTSQALQQTATVLSDTKGAGGTICKEARGLSYYSDSVAVVNGPQTLAQNKGERMAECILLALHAVASGKTDLHIAAHSRGAVQGILLIHELDRIRKALKAEPNKPLNDILLSSPAGYINVAMKTFLGSPIPGVDLPENREKLLKQLEQLQFSPFLIDPVPGNLPADVLPAILDPITWVDPRFADELPGLQRYELLTCEDERSRSFRSFVPRGLVHTPVPGHHGTAMGNPFERNKVDAGSIAPEVKIARLKVRDLVVYKLLHFINKGTGIFSRNSSNTDLQSNIFGCDGLNTLFNNYFTANDTIRNKQLIASYTQAIAVRQHTVGLRTTHYGLRAELIGMASDRVLFAHAGHTAEQQGSLQIPHKTLENELSMLTLGEVGAELVDILNKGPVDQIKKINTLLKQLVDQMGEDGSVLDASVLPLARSFADSNIQPIVFAELGKVVDAIVLNYLNTDLSDENQQEFLLAITNLFMIISSGMHNKDQAATDQLTKLHDLFKGKLVGALENRLNTITSEKGRLETQVEAFAEQKFNFDALLSTYFNELPTVFEADQITYDSIKHKLDEGRAGYKTGKDVESAITRLLTSSSIKDEVMIDLFLAFAGSKAFNDLTLTDSNEMAQNLNEIESLYNKIGKLSTGMEQLGGLVSAPVAPLSVARDESKDDSDSAVAASPAGVVPANTLEKYKEELVSLAGHILKVKQETYDLREKPENVSDTFYEKAQFAAVNQGATPPQDLDAKDQARAVAEAQARAEYHEANADRMVAEIEAAAEARAAAKAQVAAQAQAVADAQAKAVAEAQAQATADAQAVELARVKDLPYKEPVKRLKALTETYLDHLIATKAQAKGESPDAKIKIVESLKAALDDQSLSARERVIKFDGILQIPANKWTLSDRRDSYFKIFCEGALDALLGILTIGILPLVIACKPSLTFFSTAKGKGYVDESVGLLKGHKDSIQADGQELPKPPSNGI